MIFSEFYCMYKLRKAFTVFKMNSTIEALMFMSQDQFDARSGPNLQLQFYVHFKGAYCAEMINP